MHEGLTQNKLKELLYYNQLSGIFTWLERPLSMFRGEDPQRICKSWNTRFAGKEAGHKWLGQNGKIFYILIGIELNGRPKLYRAHRLVFLYLNGSLPAQHVDHIDGDGTNNSRDNLREVSKQENSKNCRISSNNTSGYNGVNWYKSGKKWRVRIKVNGKEISGGYFIKLTDAIAKRKELNIEYGFHKNHGRKQKEN